MSAHTRSPWVARRDDTARVATVAIVGEWVVGPEFESPEMADYSDHGTDEADAKLIAAAPTLLRIVQMVANLGEYRELVEAMAAPLRTHERESFIKLFREEARAAIAEATS